MDLRSSGADRSNEDPPAWAESTSIRETSWLRVHALGFDLELGGSTNPRSPKSLASCLPLPIIAILGLTCGLGGFCRWLGSPLWVSLAAAGIGLTISTSLVTAFAAYIKRPDYETMRVGSHRRRSAPQASGDLTARALDDRTDQVAGGEVRPDAAQQPPCRQTWLCRRELGRRPDSAAIARRDLPPSCRS
jgi:hypothetical protein